MKMDKEDKRSLYKRYLFWLYKTTKDELDKIDRKFTQLDIDRDMQKILQRKAKSYRGATKGGLEPFLKEWKEYIFEKESDAQKLKFTEELSLNPKYLFLRLKLEAIIMCAKRRFGSGALKEFRQLYEESALRRILSDDSGRR